jgi:hypothetical protein
MKARYDDEIVALTPRYIAALEELARAEMEMMRSRDTAYADCWDWCKITIYDISCNGGIDFQFGGEADRLPEMPTGDVLVVSAEDEEGS